MTGNSPNYFGGEGPSNPSSDVPLANQIIPEQENTQEKETRDKFQEAISFVKEYPDAEIVFEAIPDEPERHFLYATFNGDLSVPNERGEKERIYSILNRKTKKVVAVTKDPSKYTDQIRTIN